jgi:hypothetical protein
MLVTSRFALPALRILTQGRAVMTNHIKVPADGNYDDVASVDLTELSEAELSMAAGGFVIPKYVDKSSNTLAQSCAAGAHYT